MAQFCNIAIATLKAISNSINTAQAGYFRVVVATVWKSGGIVPLRTG